MSNRLIAKLHAGLKPLLACAAAVALAGAQEKTADPLPAFEVASVKPSPPNSTGQSGSSRSWGELTGRVNVLHVPLLFVVTRAYGVQPWQVGGPDWLATEPFDIVAAAPAGWTKDQIPLMFQALLAERFKLQLHRETQTAPAYALIAGSGGVKLKAAADGEIPTYPWEKDGLDGHTEGRGEARTITAITRGGPFGDFTLTMANGALHYQFPKMTMKALAQFLSAGLVGLPVVDMTELEGAYPVGLDVSPADMLAASGKPPGSGDILQPAETASDPTGGSVFASLRKLGLKLERRKAPVEKLVIDRVERRPTEN